MKRKICKECDTPLQPGAEYCGRCGAGVRQVPVGCAIFVLLGILGAIVFALLFLKSAL
ncbi:hypothetical protein [Cerasicoccus fimbriatus]|uniref:hypothetical protein n=1 Tax=Cerasicoccus fimbriatus TaxID=3014554 RepID=UPI0022B44BAC|nr:hypothetical protein [Cerasicoccus sp. TK19100]